MEKFTVTAEQRGTYNFSKNKYKKVTLEIVAPSMGAAIVKAKENKELFNFFPVK